MFGLIDTLVGLAAIVIAVGLFVLGCVVRAITRYLRHPDPRVRLTRKQGTAWMLTAGFGFAFLAALTAGHPGFAATSIILCAFAVRWLVNDSMRRRRAERAAVAARADRQNAAWWAGDPNVEVFGNAADDTPTERLW